MVDISDEQFESILSKSIDALHKQVEDAKNVAIVVADEPSPEQREKLKLRGNETLFGLYEGTPLTMRHNGYTSYVPDKITIFKNPMREYSRDIPSLEKEVHHTLWHELAHHFGLNHKQIHERE
jgi:predicted Zn-dependent protease with MMP-like domain